MPQPRPSRRLLMVGTRIGGESRYRVQVYGNPASAFPPAEMKVSLRELHGWLEQARDAGRRARDARTEDRPRLRVVG